MALFVAFHAKIHRKSRLMDPAFCIRQGLVTCCARVLRMLRVRKNDIWRHAINMNPLRVFRKLLTTMTGDASGHTRQDIQIL